MKKLGLQTCGKVGLLIILLVFSMIGLSILGFNVPGVKITSGMPIPENLAGTVIIFGNNYTLPASISGYVSAPLPFSLAPEDMHLFRRYSGIEWIEDEASDEWKSQAFELWAVFKQRFKVDANLQYVFKSENIKRLSTDEPLDVYLNRMSAAGSMVQFALSPTSTEKTFKPNPKAAQIPSELVKIVHTGTMEEALRVLVDKVGYVRALTPKKGLFPSLSLVSTPSTLSLPSLTLIDFTTGTQLDQIYDGRGIYFHVYSGKSYGEGGKIAYHIFDIPTQYSGSFMEFASIVGPVVTFGGTLFAEGKPYIHADVLTALGYNPNNPPTSAELFALSEAARHAKEAWSKDYDAKGGDPLKLPEEYTKYLINQYNSKFGTKFNPEEFLSKPPSTYTKDEYQLLLWIGFNNGGANVPWILAANQDIGIARVAYSWAVQGAPLPGYSYLPWQPTYGSYGGFNRYGNVEVKPLTHEEAMTKSFEMAMISLNSHLNPYGASLTKGADNIYHFAYASPHQMSPATMGVLTDEQLAAMTYYSALVAASVDRSVLSKVDLQGLASEAGIQLSYSVEQLKNDEIYRQARQDAYGRLYDLGIAPVHGLAVDTSNCWTLYSAPGKDGKTYTAPVKYTAYKEVVGKAPANFYHDPTGFITFQLAQQYGFQVPWASNPYGPGGVLYSQTSQKEAAQWASQKASTNPELAYLGAWLQTAREMANSRNEQEALQGLKALEQFQTGIPAGGKVSDLFWMYPKVTEKTDQKMQQPTIASPQKPSVLPQDYYGPYNTNTVSIHSETSIWAVEPSDNVVDYIAVPDVSSIYRVFSTEGSGVPSYPNEPYSSIAPWANPLFGAFQMVPLSVVPSVVPNPYIVIANWLIILLITGIVLVIADYYGFKLSFGRRKY
ncbi:MAG: hypothetical protein QXQ61_03480 [Candidatus Bathyarchaeia archaeon]